MLGDAMAWLPVFFLYFSSHLSLSEVLRLEALYYLAVVMLEVPSGYFSDRVGRKTTLVVASFAFVISYISFIVAREFFVFVFAQLTLAAGMAFRSGTDSTFLYESLHCLQREEEFGPMEARVQRQSLTVGAAAVVLGGLSASLDLSYAYWISLVTAVGALLVAIKFVEPAGGRNPTVATSFVSQFWSCLNYLKDRTLAWLFIFFVVVYILAHVPYEFYQPYLALLELKEMLGIINAPIASGILLGMTMLLGAWAAGRSIHWQRQFGLNTVLLVALLLQLLVIAIMGMWLNALVISVLLLRSIPMASVHAPMNAVIAPRVVAAQRATYLSLQSLAGRLGFSIMLFLVSIGIEVDTVNWATLSSLLQIFVVFGAIALVSLFATRNHNYS